jgi:uncharacterized protein
MQYKYISADNHVDTRWLPKTLWQERLPKHLREQGPKVVETEKGTMWTWEGDLQGESADGRNNAAMREQHFGRKGAATPEGSLPPSDPKLLLEHLDIGNMYAGVYYGDTRKWGVKDHELRKAMYRAYNDYLLEVNSHAPDRLLTLPNLPTMHPDVCPGELERLLKAGAKAVEFGVYDADPPLWDHIWEPIWSMAEEADIPICCHIGDKAGTPYPPNIYGQSRAHFSVVPLAAAKPIADIVFSGILERHPTLRVTFAECRVGWIPFLISWMDRQVTGADRPEDPTAHLTMLPSEYFKRQMTVTFEDDVIGAKMIPFEWSHLRETAMWGPDYPHGQGVWPRVDEAMERMFADFDDELKAEVTYHRAARVFRLNAPPRAASASSKVAAAVA